MDEYGGILVFPDRAAAKALAAELDAAPYELAHGETGRPVYLARKIRHRSAYGVYVRYDYAPGTLRRKPDGFMSVAQAWRMGLFPAQGNRV